MKESINFTLIGDGSSDKILMVIIKWLLDDLYPKLPINGQFADFRFLENAPEKGDIKGQIKKAKELYPCDLIFYHRDAESNRRDILKKRTEEIKNQLNPEDLQITVCIIPIKMMETWLLIDKEAIKKAAGNRNYNGDINLPPIKHLEDQDSKKVLFNLLKQVSGLKGRNLKKFNSNYAVHLVAEYIEDFSILRNLLAFKHLEYETKNVVDNVIELSNKKT